MATHKCVWLDKEKAYIITNNGKDELMDTIYSEVDLRERYPGETNQGSRFGKQSVINERSKEERIKHQTLHYYQSIIDKIKDADAIHLIGPAEAKVELSKLINNKPDIDKKLKTVESSDKLTENQLKAKVRDLVN